jgi:predicted RND superfamily exporter protein
MRNAIVIAIGFLPLLLSPLVPYNTVGFLMAAIMAISSLVTVMLLPAIMTNIKKWLSPRKEAAHSGAHFAATSVTANKEKMI